MSIDALLSDLNGVKRTGYGKYVARCPAHDDKSPSLAIKNCGDGRILLHCFAGCETEDVLSAVGLTFSDLMPERIGDKHSFKLRRFDARQVLATLDHESLVVAIVGADFLQYQVLDEPTCSRLMQAVGRINTARAICFPAKIGP
jgi:hypothetical protein